MAYLPGPRVHADDETVTFFFGALNREDDWAELMPVLNRLLDRFRNRLRFEVIYDQEFFNALETDQKRFTPWCKYEEYQRVLHGCDIGLLPLSDTEKNRMKSDLKFLEYAGHGVTAVASPVVYERTITDGDTGLIYRSLEEFEAQLMELIEDASLRRRLAASAYEWVGANRLLCQHYHTRHEWYLKMFDELPRLTDELRHRMPVLCD